MGRPGRAAPRRPQAVDRRARRRGDLGDRVGPVEGTYLTTWLTEVSNLASVAQTRSDGLAEFTRSVVDFDEAAADDLRAMLPWDDQDAVRVRVLVSATPEQVGDDPQRVGSKLQALSDCIELP